MLNRFSTLGLVAVFIIGKAHGSRIYAETLPRRLRAIREDMPKMGVTVPAANFGAHHAVRGVRQVADRIIADRLVKLGQPQPESYFVWELNSGASHTVQW